VSTPFPKTAPRSFPFISLYCILRCVSWWLARTFGTTFELQSVSRSSSATLTTRSGWCSIARNLPQIGDRTTATLPQYKHACLSTWAVTNADRMWLRANYACGPRPFLNTFNSCTQIRMEDYFFFSDLGNCKLQRDSRILQVGKHRT
jgi:hypothetical protein